MSYIRPSPEVRGRGVEQAGEDNRGGDLEDGDVVRYLADRFGVIRRELGVGGGRTKGDATAADIGYVDESQFARSSGGLVESGGESSSLGDVVELLRVKVVQEDKEAKRILDGGKTVLRGQGGHGGVGEYEACHRLPRVYLISYLRLRHVAVVDTVIREAIQYRRYVVAIRCCCPH
ncbi:hypothetical protein IEQ34_005457 [Dendrobium chrysotoxum]|uniref:Uncharacterized protein n=1 Tax=Dendrobium chrysotoxum TaxID=161865 RepID=A0AAV7HB72_DENCH|nr:hypothetical protein IEQ34_005457 [Dendrobium chrysotoxum]